MKTTEKIKEFAKKTEELLGSKVFTKKQKPVHKKELSKRIYKFCRVSTVTAHIKLTVLPDKALSKIRHKYTTVSDFCENYGFTKEDFDKTINLLPCEKTSIVLNSLYKEKFVNKSLIMGIWNVTWIIKGDELVIVKAVPYMSQSSSQSSKRGKVEERNV